MNHMHRRIVINVSGSRFETFESTLARFPDTLLGSPFKRMPYFDICSNEYFFDRNRRAFDAILFYYQSYGKISKPANMSEKLFLEELKFFEIGKEKDFLTFAEKVDRYIVGELTVPPRNKIKLFVWNLFRNPASSTAACIVNYMGVSTLTLSIALTCVESLPNLENPKDVNDRRLKKLSSVLNNICYVWFTIEFLCRLFSAVDKKKFIKSVLNLIDMVAILPYYIQMIIESNTKMTPLSIFRIFRLFRVARILKFSRYSRGMRALIYTLYASRHELGLLFFILFISTLVSGTLTYYAEINDANTFLTSIPESLWWSINTITTVGYGDTYPITTFGKALGGMFSMFGTVLIGLPILCLVSNFLELWDSIRDSVKEAQDCKHSDAKLQTTVMTNCCVNKRSLRN